MSNFNQNVYGAVIKNSVSLQKAFLDHIVGTEKLPTREVFEKGLTADSSNQVIMNYNIIQAAIALIEEDRFNDVILICTPNDNNAVKTANKVITFLRILIQATDIDNKLNIMPIIVNRSVKPETETETEETETETPKNKNKNK